MERIRTKISALLTRSGPAKSPVPVKEVASIKGLLASTWVSTGSAANMRTRALGWVVESRPCKDAWRPRASWGGRVNLSEPALAELHWWSSNLPRVNGQDIIPQLLSGQFDGVGKCDASDTGCGGWLATSTRSEEGSALYNNLRKTPVLGLSVRRSLGPSPRT